MASCDMTNGVKPVMMMVVVQVALAGVNIFYKLAANEGMSLPVIVVYRFLFSSAVMFPLAFVLERGQRPRMTWTVLFQTFLCALFGGTLVQNLTLKGLALTSATFVSAITNLVPAFTFVLALFFRLERLGLGNVTGKAKVVGTVMGIGGAMLLTFYRGLLIDFMKTNINLLSSASHVSPPPQPSAAAHRILGAFLLLGSCFFYALWLIIQTKMSEKYPCFYTSTALTSLMGLGQAAIYALCVERDQWNKWKLGWNIRLWTVTYSGIVGSGLTVTLMAWCVRSKGPLFVSVFSPLLLILVAVAGALFLDEKLYLGSVLGAILIVGGLYVVLWGKGKEVARMTRLAPSEAPQEQQQEQQENVNVVIESLGDAIVTQDDVVRSRTEDDKADEEHETKDDVVSTANKAKET